MRKLRPIVIGISTLIATPTIAQVAQAPDFFQSAPGPESAPRSTARAHPPPRPVRKAEPPQLEPVAAPTSEPRAHSASRSHSSRRGSVPTVAESGEATRLMIEQLQQRGVAMGTAGESDPPQLEPVAAPTLEPRAHSDSRSHSSRRGSVPTVAESGEATRLMIEQLQQRGVAVGTAGESGSAK